MAKQKNFRAVMEELYGDELDKVFIRNEEPVEAISTGSLALDVCIGVGGIPLSRYSVIDGPEGSGKSTLALSVAKTAINNKQRVLYVDVENQMFFDYIADLIGQNLENNEYFSLAKPADSDEAFMIMEAAISSGEFDLIILDSIAALTPPEDAKGEKDFDEATMAIIPRDLARFLRRNAYEVRTKKVAVLFINQVRDSIGSYTKGYSTPGGHALKHMASLIVSLTKGDSIKAGQEVIGIMPKFTIRKNKLAPPFRAYTIPIIFGVGVDTLRDVVDYASMLGVIKKNGPYYRYEETTLGKGMLATMEFLSGNKEVLDFITKSCYNVISKYKQELTEESEENSE